MRRSNLPLCFATLVIVTLAACVRPGKQRSLLDIPYTAAVIMAVAASGNLDAIPAPSHHRHAIDGGTGVTTVSGRVETIDMRAARFEVVELVRGGTVVATTTTDNAGRFEINAQLADGRYEARLASARLLARQLVVIDGYRVSGLVLIATERALAVPVGSMK
jgi:hypothetical protein